MTTIKPKWWKPDIYLRHQSDRLARATVFQATRHFFATENFTEVDTPALQISPGLEVHLKAFRTAYDNPLGDRQTFYLHTSPEFTMKKLITAGLPRIFQLCKTYRNEGVSATHQPEFTMLEWYRAGADYTQIMTDTENLARTCTRACDVRMWRQGNRTCNPFLPWERLTVAQAFQRYTGIDLPATLPADPRAEPDPTPLRRAAENIGEQCYDSDRWEDIFFRIMLNHIEKYLGDDVPTILYEYPTCLGALARMKPTDQSVVERFEAYACGMELCNAFSELTDPAEQRRRFTADMTLKEKLYGEQYPIDEDFLDALTYGMPACAGNAIGMDRLVMLITGADHITDVQWAPIAVAEE